MLRVQCHNNLQRKSGNKSLSPFLKAKPQMPEKLEQTIRDMPRDREAVELFKKLTGPDPLPQR